MRLDLYTASDFQRGKPGWVEALWSIVQAFFVSSWLPGSKLRVALLRMFGAELGKGLVIKPGLRVKFPWRLRIGDHSWIGESCWIDNLAEVSIGSHCCLSQGTYLCTGSHDWTAERFDLITHPIRINDRAWLCARSTVAPGVEVGKGAILGLGAVATKNLASWTIYKGNPASPVGMRRIRADAD